MNAAELQRYEAIVRDNAELHAQVDRLTVERDEARSMSYKNYIIAALEKLEGAHINKIGAIKAIREMTELSLKDSKALLESIIGHSKESSP